jgi:hypothetical protein
LQVRQRDEVKQLIVEMNQFKDANDPEECQLTEERLERLAYKLSSLAQSWKSILSQEHFLEFFGLLLNSAIEELSEYFKALNDRLASQMMEIDRVAEETFLVKYWINRHFNSQVEQWMQVFVEENGQRTHQMQSSPIAKYVVRWQEFLTLTSN